MGRVRSQLKHDYKPRRSLPTPGSARTWAVIGAVLAAVGLVTIMVRSGATESSAVAAAAATSSAASGAAAAVTTIAIPLPGQARPAGGDTDPALLLPPLPAEQPQMDPVEASAAAEHVSAAEDIVASGSDRPVGQPLAIKIRRGDSLDTVFRRHDLSVADLAQMLRLKEARNALKVVKPGDEIDVVRDGSRVLSLDRKLSEETTLQIVRENEAFVARFLVNPVERRPAQARATIDTSFFEAGKDAGLSDSLIMNLAGVFAWDIDFALEIREGDSFSVIYEEIWQDDRRLRDGEVLAAEFVNQGRVYRAIRYQDPEGRVDYFTPDGLSVKKAFLRAPVDFTRVSSNFNPNRLHPILKTRRPHKGVDYAAPKGTPVKAAGDGRIIFRGRNGGYGNCVIIQHGGNVTTLYGHLSSFAKSARNGSRVSQGQVIGFVGATGLATAPHLHYEYRLNGVHRNPRTVPLPEAAPVADKYRDQFMENSRPLIARLDAINPPRLASAD